MNETASGSPAVEAKDLFRSFGRKEALSGVSIAVHAGECVALFGPNGAGKTTLLRTFGGLLRPTRGGASIEGRSLPGDAAIRAHVGMVSHHSLLYDALSALENVMFAARLYSMQDPRGAATRTLDRMGMSAKMNAPVRSLSRGMQQRVSIARATVHSPVVILADEPYSGLDEEGSRSLTVLLGELRAAGAAMIVVTHNISEGFALATHAAVMSAGRIVSYAPRDSMNDAGFPARYRALVGGGR
jgi:heme exporter protein A